MVGEPRMKGVRFQKYLQRLGGESGGDEWDPNRRRKEAAERWLKEGKVR